MSSESISEKIAVLAPMPSASDSTTTAVMTGVRAHCADRVAQVAHSVANMLHHSSRSAAIGSMRAARRAGR